MLFRSQNPRGTEREYVNSAFWLSFLRALGLACLLVITAPWIAKFYGNPELATLLRFTALTLVFDGATSPLVCIAIKNLKFYRLAMISNGGGICGVILTVVLSYYMRNIWALVLGQVAESAFRLTFSYVLYPFLPSLALDRDAIRSLLNFSRG